MELWEVVNPGSTASLVVWSPMACLELGLLTCFWGLSACKVCRSKDKRHRPKEI